MPAVVADTHALIWYLLNPSKLSPNAHAVLMLGDFVYISAITLVEMRYLVEKGTITEEVFEFTIESLNDDDLPPILVPVDMSIAQALERIERSDVPDMPDRIIAATALHLNLPLVTRDQKIQAAGIKTIW